MWAHRIGDARAKRMLFTGELIDGRFNGMDFEVRISDNRPEGSLEEDSAPFDPLSLPGEVAAITAR